MKNSILLFILFVSFFSCKRKNNSNIDISGISVDFSVSRFATEFYNSSEKTWTKVKKKYPMLFPKNVPDSIWIHKINNPEERELFAEIQKQYQDFSPIKKQITSLFKHIKYYYPTF